jgi:mono/diheme cytochrome c family protein
MRRSEMGKMSIFAEKLKPEEIAALAAYVRPLK